MRPLPPLAIAVALAFWGWRSGNYATAAALALLLEAPRFLPPRFQLGAADFDRVTDLCAVLFAALLGWLFISLEAPRAAGAGGTPRHGGAAGGSAGGPAVSTRRGRWTSPLPPSTLTSTATGSAASRSP